MSFLGLFTFTSHTKSYDIAHSPSQYLYKFNQGYFRVDKLWLRSLEDPFLFFYSKDRGSWCEPLISHQETSQLWNTADSLAQFKNKLSSLDDNFSCGIVFEEANNSVHIARDAFGKIPIFYYYQKHSFIAFSSDLTQLLNLEEIRKGITLNHGTIYKYLSLSDQSRPYSSQTFYNEINSALPGKLTSFTSNTIFSQDYINYNPTKWSHLSTANEFGTVLADLLRKSVAKAISNKNNIGSQLSGGLDSSSIACLVNDLQPDSKLQTFYCDTSSALGDERKFSNEVANYINSCHHSVKPSQNDLEQLIFCTSLYGRPEYMALTPSFQNSLIKQAKISQCEILLTGHDGDSIIGSGRTYLSQLFGIKDWDNIKSILSSLADRNNLYQLNSDWQNLDKYEREKLIILHYFNREILGNLKDLEFVKTIETALAGKKYFNISTSDYFDLGVKAITTKFFNASSCPNSIQSRYLKENKLILDNNSETIINSTNQQPYYDDILFTQNIAINEEYFALSINHNISIRHPFFDKNLYELCLAVPTKIKFGNGLGRGHLRQGMAGYLPENIRLRKDKALFNSYSSKAALRLFNQGQQDFLNPQNVIWNFVDYKNFQRAVKILQQPKLSYQVNHRMTFFVNRTIFLSVWLNQVRI